MNIELYELNLEIQKVRSELGDILKQGDDFIENELTINTSQKLDKLIVKYMQISR